MLKVNFSQMKICLRYWAPERSGVNDIHRLFTFSLDRFCRDFPSFLGKKPKKPKIFSLHSFLLIPEEKKTVGYKRRTMEMMGKLQ